MAHIFDIPAYVEGKRVSKQTQYPKNSDVFKGFNSPTRYEGEIFDLEVYGEIPKAIDGTFYRIQPDHRFPPTYEDDIHFNGGISLSLCGVDAIRWQYFRVSNS
jgi:carotenoid cleavage dioxygenase-like enzyme